MQKNQIVVISLGGSIIAPQTVDADFLSLFCRLMLTWLTEEEYRRLIIVTGGGAPAREYQKACRQIVPHCSNETQDWIGIAATRLNAQLVKSLFGSLCPHDIVEDPTGTLTWESKVLVAAGWKPGFSTDFSAVLLANRFSASSLINLSNIEQVYTDDPRANPQAKPIHDITWSHFQTIVGTEWIPGKNTPFDPIAAKKAAELGLKVCIAYGKDLNNLLQILHGQPFLGTLIHP